MLKSALDKAFEREAKLIGERDTARASAEKAEAWITAHEQYLGEMQTSLCVHGNLHVPVTKIREWFSNMEFIATTPEPTTEEVKP